MHKNNFYCRRTVVVHNWIEKSVLNVEKSFRRLPKNELTRAWHGFGTTRMLRFCSESDRTVWTVSIKGQKMAPPPPFPEAMGVYGIRHNGQRTAKWISRELPLFYTIWKGAQAMLVVQLLVNYELVGKASFSSFSRWRFSRNIPRQFPPPLLTCFPPAASICHASRRRMELVFILYHYVRTLPGQQPYLLPRKAPRRIVERRGEREREWGKNPSFIIAKITSEAAAAFTQKSQSLMMFFKEVEEEEAERAHEFEWEEEEGGKRRKRARERKKEEKMHRHRSLPDEDTENEKVPLFLSLYY